jgi:hypothetical protein
MSVSQSLLPYRNLSLALLQIKKSVSCGLFLRWWTYFLASSRFSIGEVKGLFNDIVAAIVNMGSRHRKMDPNKSILLILRSAGMLA